MQPATATIGASPVNRAMALHVRGRVPMRGAGAPEAANPTLDRPVEGEPQPELEAVPPEGATQEG
jgi:hypothetical protein